VPSIDSAYSAESTDGTLTINATKTVFFHCSKYTYFGASAAGAVFRDTPGLYLAILFYQPGKQLRVLFHARFNPGKPDFQPVKNCGSSGAEWGVSSQSHALFTLLNSPVAGVGCISHPEQARCGNRHRHAQHFLLIGHIRLINDYHICQIKCKSKICAYNSMRPATT